MAINVTADTVGDYLVRDRGVLDGPIETVQSLGGGVSNAVLKVETATECIVVKQPFPNLDVAEDWPADVVRVHNEAAAARAYAEIIEREGIDDVRVPRVLFEDRNANVVGIECAAESTSMWKTDLLAGRVDPDVARSVGRTVGIVHRVARTDDDLRERFADPLPFEQLRLDPYHRTVAERHPDLADAIHAEIDRIEGATETLVHGDYSPKNVLVDREGSANWILDFEVAHWGDPAFDVAFMINHLLIKSLYVAERGAEYVEAIGEFWDGYRDATERNVEREVVAELGVLLLARIDGKSPVEYVESERTADAIRSTGRTVLRDAVTTLADVLTVAAEERDRL